MLNLKIFELWLRNCGYALFIQWFKIRIGTLLMFSYLPFPLLVVHKKTAMKIILLCCALFFVQVNFLTLYIIIKIYIIYFNCRNCWLVLLPSAVSKHSEKVNLPVSSLYHLQFHMLCFKRYSFYNNRLKILIDRMFVCCLVYFSKCSNFSKFS